MTQRQQEDVRGRFERGEFRVLVATAVAEEGLHLPEVDLVVFYEPIPDVVRVIQRRGRTGRERPGRVVILTTDKTRDERYLHAAVKQERKARRMVRALAAQRTAAEVGT
jgi:ERCC4-related helicase